jgi:adenine deaminase
VARDGVLVAPCAEGPASPPLQTVHLGPVRANDFVLRIVGAPDRPTEPPAWARLRSINGIINTAWAEADVDLRGSEVIVPEGYILQAVVHRHGRIAAKVQLALAGGWGSEWEGAIATTVSHDTHNLVVFGRDPVDMAAAANAVIATQGGVAVASRGEVLAQIALPIAGILSDRPAPEVAEAQRRLLAAARHVGLPEGVLSQPLMQVMAASLACLPGPHLTDLGLMDGTTGELIAEPVLAGPSLR